MLTLTAKKKCFIPLRKLLRLLGFLPREFRLPLPREFILPFPCELLPFPFPFPFRSYGCIRWLSFSWSFRFVPPARGFLCKMLLISCCSVARNISMYLIMNVNIMDYELVYLYKKVLVYCRRILISFVFLCQMC